MRESAVVWSSKLDSFGRSILRELGYDPNYLPRDHNPITRALREDQEFVAKHEADREFNRTSLSKVATICQMVIFDATGGPERDGNPKALRRHWYQWYKVHFAQPLALQYGDYEVVGGIRQINDLAWTQRLSTTYAWFVDEMGVTYDDLWVEDASRMIKRIDQELFTGANIVIAVEKDSLFSDFTIPAQALGAKVVYSGKGKSSKAAIEKMLRDHFRWTDKPRWDYDVNDYVVPQIFTKDNPLVILHISDHDFDGEAVIGPTFGEQVRRYTPHVLEARIGIDPIDVEEKGYNLEDVMYQVKVSHKGYVEWAEDKALFLGECIQCGQTYVVESIDPGYSDCCGAPFATLSVGRGGDTAYGLEVEAMTVRDYHDLLVQALLRVLPFDYIVFRLRHHIQADAWNATEQIRRQILEQNKGYRNLMDEVERLDEVRRTFEQEIIDAISPIAEEHQGDFWEHGDDPEPEEFEMHVVEAERWTGPWRPFDASERTDLLVEWLQENEEGIIQSLIERQVEF